MVQGSDLVVHPSYIYTSISNWRKFVISRIFGFSQQWLWGVLSCSPMKINWHFGETYCLHLQVQIISQTRARLATCWYQKMNTSIVAKKNRRKIQMKFWLNSECTEIWFVLFFNTMFNYNMTLKHILNQLYILNFFRNIKT
jgi:hypothetical protein